MAMSVATQNVLKQIQNDILPRPVLLERLWQISKKISIFATVVGFCISFALLPTLGFYLAPFARMTTNVFGSLALSIFQILMAPLNWIKSSFSIHSILEWGFFGMQLSLGGVLLFGLAPIYTLPFVMSSLVVISAILGPPALLSGISFSFFYIAQKFPHVLSVVYSAYKGVFSHPPEISAKEYRELVYYIYDHNVDTSFVKEQIINNLDDHHFNIVATLIKLGAHPHDFKKYTTEYSKDLAMIFQTLSKTTSQPEAFKNVFQDKIAMMIPMPDKADEEFSQKISNTFLTCWNRSLRISLAKNTTMPEQKDARNTEEPIPLLKVTLQ